MIAAVAGGVGAARFLRGLVRTVPPADVTVIVNTGDDEVFHGLHVSPDIDTVVYTLAGLVNPETGWGVEGDTFRTLGELGRLGEDVWFRLGDLDLATHLFRTRRLLAGMSLSAVTAELVAARGLDLTVLPMTDDPAPTVIETAEHGPMAMQEWFVGHRCEPRVAAVELGAASTAAPAPGVVEALASADVVVICPSNPLISVGPVLAVPGVREALATRRDRVVAVSPIVGGKALKGPAAALMSDLGLEPSCAAVASLYADVCGTLVIDEADAEEVATVEEAGLRAVVAPTIMRDVEASTALAETVLAAVAP
ncbi:MAG TPA: 2-phospho-L-lactate transferase [Acidimicrobiia bacterium]|nr:2-phospho-L-lactate transferase [Acidimicrobiia bacterium]